MADAEHDRAQYWHTHTHTFRYTYIRTGNKALRRKGPAPCLPLTRGLICNILPLIRVICILQRTLSQGGGGQTPNQHNSYDDFFAFDSFEGTKKVRSILKCVFVFIFELNRNCHWIRFCKCDYNVLLIYIKKIIIVCIWKSNGLRFHI